MQRILFSILLAGFATSFSAPATAQEGGARDRAALRDKFDTNKDGKLDEAERAAARKAIAKARQAKADGKGKGKGKGKNPHGTPTDPE